MEFAVSALLLLLLVLPGFIIQLAYAKGLWRWNSPISSRPVSEQIPSSIIFAAFLHLIWYPIGNYFEKIDLGVLMMFLLGDFGHEEEHFDSAIQTLTAHPYKIALYFLTLYAFSALLGIMGHSIVRKCGLDHKSRVLRFNNEWWYWLHGEITQFTETPEFKGKVGAVDLTAVVHHEGGDYLYQGVVEDFFFDKDGNLDRVILRNVRRRKLEDDRPPKRDGEVAPEVDGRYYDIVGDYFVLRYSEMSTINLFYWVLEEVQEAPELTVEPLPQDERETGSE